MKNLSDEDLTNTFSLQGGVANLRLLRKWEGGGRVSIVRGAQCSADSTPWFQAGKVYIILYKEPNLRFFG